MDPHPALRFGPFELRQRQRQLLQDGVPVALGARAFDLLLALVERRERMVAKVELLDIVWPGLVVQENNLQVQISTLRRLLGPQAITTIPGRGYRFTAALDGGAGDAPHPAAPRQPPTPARTNLPATLAPLYGRSADLTVLRSLVQASRLVSVLGTGGIGKSRLAQALAREQAEQQPDGSWLVELAGLSDPALLPATVAQALGMALPGGSRPNDELAAGLATQALLLVLDNCEHLLDAVTALARALLHHAPRVTLLLTSQEPLRLPEEQQYRMAALSVPSTFTPQAARESGAVALLLARVRAVDLHFDPDDDGLALAVEICRRLDGLPLAIELAAPRVATLGLRQVRDRLDARLQLLTGGSRAAPRRQQTLRATLAWSHQMLEPTEQAVLRRLGVFAGGFTVALAQAVVGDDTLDDWAVLDTLGALVDKSLVVAEPGDPPRYRLLESTRAFALEQLSDDEGAATRGRHALALRDFCTRIDGAHLDGELLTDEMHALLVPEIDNLRAALATASDAPDIAVALACCANSLEDFATESTRWLLRLRPAVDAGAAGPAGTARYWRAIASMNATLTGLVPRAEQARAAALAQDAYIAQGLPRRAFSSAVLFAIHQRVVARDLGLQPALAAAEAARTLLQPDWPDTLRVRLMRLDARLAIDAGRPTEALATQREVARISARTGDWLLEVMARWGLSSLLWQTGSLPEAAAEMSSLVEALRGQPVNCRDAADIFTMWLTILAETDRLDEALRQAGEALQLMRRGWWGEVDDWVYLLWRAGRMDAAARLLGALDARRARVGISAMASPVGLLEAAREGVRSALSDADFARETAAGAALDEAALLATIGAALAAQAGDTMPTGNGTPEGVRSNGIQNG